MKNYWLDRIKERDLIVAARWQPPQDDECGWIPIRPTNVCAEVGEDLPGLTITACEEGWKRVELQGSCVGYFGGPAEGTTGTYEITNIPAEMSKEEEYQLKLEILAQNPGGLFLHCETLWDLRFDF